MPGAGVVTIFDPFPLVTITIEDRDGQDELHLHAGGQGVWVGRMALSLGATVRLVTSVGGEVGDVLAHLAAIEGIELRAVHARNGSAAYVHDRREGGRAELASVIPAPLGRHELDELYGEALVEASDADAFVLAGPLPGTSLPEGTYQRLTEDVSRVQPCIVADLAGSALTEALAGGPITVLKISHEELVESGHAVGDDPSELAAAARRLQEHGAANVVVSRKAEPTLALLNGQVLEVITPTFVTHDGRGGGDAMAAALAVGLASGEPIEEAVKVGAAAGALNVTRRGLASVNPDHARRLARRVTLRPAEI